MYPVKIEAICDTYNLKRINEDQFCYNDSENSIWCLEMGMETSLSLFLLFSINLLLTVFIFAINITFTYLAFINKTRHQLSIIHKTRFI